MLKLTRLPLALVAIALNVGCVTTRPRSAARRSDLIGYGTSATMHVGSTSREAVVKQFGKPTYSTRKGRAFGYLFSVDGGTQKGLVWGPCMPALGTQQIWDNDDLWLEFDEHGILSRVEKLLLAEYDDDTEAAWRAFAATVPDSIRTEQMSDGQP